MINPFKEINWSPDSSDLRKFAWSLIIGFPCLAIVFFFAKWMKTHAMPEAHFFLALGGIGAGAGLLCLLLPVMARPLYYVWSVIGACIGIVMANLILTLMFYALFAPVGLIMRLGGRDPLNLKWKKGGSSHWIDAAPAPPAEQYFSQF